MEVILVALIIVGIWLVLNHIRKQNFDRDYMEFKKNALEKNMDTTNSDLIFLDHSKGEFSLKIAILAIVLGIATAFFLGFLSSMFHNVEADVIKIFSAFAFFFIAVGVGSLLIWIFIDRPKKKRIIERLQNKSIEKQGN